MRVGDGTPGPGRPKGTPNKAGKAFKDALLATFEDLGGQAHLTEWAQANPTDFYKIASKLIPQELNATVRGSLTTLLAGVGRAPASDSDDPPVA